MTSTQIILLTIGSFSAGAVCAWAPLSDRIRQLRIDIKEARATADDMVANVAKRTAECVEIQRLAHQAQDGLDMAKDMLVGEIAAHKTTKRQLAAAKGQITRLRKRLA